MIDVLVSENRLLELVAFARGMLLDMQMLLGSAINVAWRSKFQIIVRARIRHFPTDEMEKVKNFLIVKQKQKKAQKLFLRMHHEFA